MSNQNKQNSGFIITLVFIIVIIILLAMNFNSLILANDYREKISNLAEEFEELKYEHEKIKYEQEKSLDEDEIRRIAKEELGLVDPDEEHYIVG